jgi:hypothetical protein
MMVVELAEMFLLFPNDKGRINKNLYKPWNRELPISSELISFSTSSPTETPFLKFIRGKLPIRSCQALQGQSFRWTIK